MEENNSNNIQDGFLNSLMEKYDEKSNHEKVGISEEEYLKTLKHINSYEQDFCESLFINYEDLSEDDGFDRDIVEKVMACRTGDDYEEWKKLDKTYVEKEVEVAPLFDWESFYKNLYENIDKYKDICSYQSPFIKDVNIVDNRIVFETQRWVGGDELSGQSIFDLNGKPLEISPFEKEYIKEKKESSLDSQTNKKINKNR